MTGFDSKRQAAKAKLDDDDDTQVYADTLLIVYQRGFADGKAAQRKPLTDDEINGIAKNYALTNPTTPLHFARAIEAAHNIGEKT